jgi:hypothetical protein
LPDRYRRDAITIANCTRGAAGEEYWVPAPANHGTRDGTGRSRPWSGPPRRYGIRWAFAITYPWEHLNWQGGSRLIMSKPVTLELITVFGSVSSVFKRRLD